MQPKANNCAQSSDATSTPSARTALSSSETASNLLAKNIYNFIELIYDKENKKVKIDKEDEIIKNVLVNGEM